jgi:hypothetical protein
MYNYNISEMTAAELVEAALNHLNYIKTMLNKLSPYTLESVLIQLGEIEEEVLAERFSYLLAIANEEEATQAVTEILM